MRTPRKRAGYGPDHRTLFALSPALLQRIEDYRFAERHLSRVEAVRALLDDALTRYERHRPAKPPNE